jgi:hypothetical protein
MKGIEKEFFFFRPFDVFMIPVSEYLQDLILLLGRGLAVLNPYKSRFFVIWQKSISQPCLVWTIVSIACIYHRLITTRLVYKSSLRRCLIIYTMQCNYSGARKEIANNYRYIINN